MSALGLRDLRPALTSMRLPVLGLVAVAALNAVVFFAYTRPAWNDTTAVTSSAAVSEAANAAIEPRLREAREVYGRIATAEDDLQALRGQVGERSGTVADVVSTLRAALDAAGMRAERVTYAQEPIVELGLTRLQVGLPVRGDYGDLRRFLDELLDGPMFVVLERISAATPSQNDRTGELMLALNASVFIAPVAGAGAGAADEAETPDIETTEAEASTAPARPTSRNPVAEANRLANRLANLPQIPLGSSDFDLFLERLEEPPLPAAATRRDLFSFALPRATAVPDRDAVVDEGPPDPVMPYELIGVNRAEDGLSATLVDGSLVLVVREGQILPDGYRVARISPMEVTLEAGLETNVLSLRAKRDRDNQESRP
jgi:hypothetical protein